MKTLIMDIPAHFTIFEQEEKTMERKYKEQAATVAAAILEMASNPSSLENFKTYLSFHFAEWLEKWANDPDNMACEFKEFSKIR